MKNLKQKFCCLLACAAGLLFGVQPYAMADIVVYDNGAPDHLSGNNMGFARQAEDFTLSAGTILTDVHFWSLEASGAYRGSISWAILTNVCCQPGATLASGTQGAVTRTNTGSYLGLTEYLNEFNFNTPVTVGTGTYWLVLHNGSFSDNGDPNEFLWETAAGNASRPGRESFDNLPVWTSNFNQHAFQITAVPEPSLVLMLLAGMALVACVRQRDQRSDTFAK
jgi:hypothetical protein